MIQKFIVALVLTVVVFTAVPHVLRAQTTTSRDTETLERQITALRAYIARVQSVGEDAALSDDTLRTVIKDGVDWFKRSQEQSGHFRYEYVPYEGRYRVDDNIVRQAGGLYALSDILRTNDTDDFDLSRTVERSIAYLTSMTREDTYEGEKIACIVRSATSPRCTLGGTSLALIGILGYIEFNPREEKTYAPLAKKYLTYILAMQKPEGGFRDSYTLGSKKQKDDESPFSNGEALLALTRYEAFKTHLDVRPAIDRALAYLKTQPFDNNLYLWAMAAVKDLNTRARGEQYVAYAEEFTTWRMNEASFATQSNHNYCGYAEGLASALSIVEDTTLSEATRKELDLLNAKHRHLQLRESDRTRVLLERGQVRLKTLRDPKQAYGGFLTSDSEPTQRIDFTQHCLSAYLQTLVDLDREKL